MPRRPYPWPATLLNADMMHRLMLHRERSGQTITSAILAAVDAYCAASEAAEGQAAIRAAEGDGTPGIAVDEAARYTADSALLDDGPRE